MNKFLSLFSAAVIALLSAGVANAATTWNDVVHYGAGGSEIGYIVAKASPGTSITGSTSETVLANIKIPAGFLGPNARIHIDTYWSFTGTAGTKTRKIYFNSSAAAGGTAYLNAAGSSTDLGANYSTDIIANGATNAQVGGPAAGNYSASSSALPTGTIDTTADSYIVMSMTLGNSGDTGTLTGYTVTILK
jgi:hypothetical protein